MEKNWNKIYSTSNFYTAEMVRQMLIDNNIPAVIMNKQDSSYRFGFVEVFIHQDNETAAKALIAEFDAGNPMEEE
ncbi:MAG TPA: DUF2007 domain-containing protein [Sphingobacteriaceae bacterium]|nr:DUF2007 domain-containing protein [Sphingobacteriaceae bacterium]